LSVGGSRIKSGQIGKSGTIYLKVTDNTKNHIGLDMVSYVVGLEPVVHLDDTSTFTLVAKHKGARGKGKEIQGV